MARALGLGTLVLAALAPQPKASGDVSVIQVDPDSGFFVDEQGRVRIFHGLNVVYKESPFLPETTSFDAEKSLTDEDMDNLRSWGFNMVRLGVMWAGVEPTKGQISQSYLEQVGAISSSLAQHGVYTLVDLHQDLLARRYCGEGVPDFYVDELLANPDSQLSKALPFPEPSGLEPMKVNASGYPSLKECLTREFATYYPTERVGALFHELYTQGTELNNGFVRYWESVATAFKDSPQILGYELLNEPSPYCLGNNWESCLNLDPFLDSHFEDHTLIPFYQSIAAKIRAIDRTKPLFAEPGAMPKLDGHLPFSRKPLGEDPQQVLSYHIYCQPGDGKGWFNDKLCIAAEDIFMSTNMRFLKHFKGVGGFMTEFGAIRQNPGALKHVERLLDKIDAHLQSWAYWQFKYYEDYTTADSAEPLYNRDGTLEVEKLKVLSRTYAQAVAGVPINMGFDSKSADFYFIYEANATQAVQNLPTEIYLNEALHYPGGFDIEVLPSDCMEAKKVEQNRIHVVPTRQSLRMVDGKLAWACSSSIEVRIQARTSTARWLMARAVGAVVTAFDVVKNSASSLYV